MTNPYTIKNLKTLNTSDGQALTANLYRAGKKVGMVEDDGHGGEVYAFFTTPADNEQFEAWVATLGTITHPAKYGFPTLTVPHNTATALEMLVSDALKEKEAAKLNKAAQTKLLYRKTGDGAGMYRSTALHPSVLGKPAAIIVALYTAEAPWFKAVNEIWVSGHGWTAVTIRDCREQVRLKR